MTLLYFASLFLWDEFRSPFLGVDWFGCFGFSNSNILYAFVQEG